MSVPDTTKKKERLRIIVGVTFVLFICLLFLIPLILFYSSYGKYANEALRPKTGAPFDAGNRIIAALDVYRIDFAHYPKTLSLLVPSYLPQIPDPEWGSRRWDYSVYEREGHESYGLSVSIYKTDYVGHYYESDRKDWWYDD